ncbi:MAG: class I SAM-dependent methyltransferase [Ferruginibacter sp.]|nr:class I SAM-dependent methyltransferase [Cytophagales bacterium]
MAHPTRPEWFLEWFSSPYWHILYKNRDRKEAHLFMDALASTLRFRPEDQILDLACGRGRHAIYLNQRGFDVTGVDISPENIAYAGQFTNEHLRFLVHDMREPFPVFPFDWVLNLFTSFGYFQTEAENFRAIRAVADALRTGGRLVVDFMNTDKILRELKSHETKVIDGYEFHLHKRVREGFILKDIDFEIDGEIHYFQERVKVLRQDDFERYFDAAGLRPLHLFGDYALQSFDPTQSDRLIFVVEKSL